MPEILTESFCERCGTRYTFEAAAPRAKGIGRIRTLSKGLKNFVMSDDTSLDEALAAARSDFEREATAHQLDAFHKTFNFCMTCRQYTCSNCWNDVEGRCLTCAPHLGHEILPAPFPNLAVTTDATAYAGNGTNGHDPTDILAWPTADLPRDDEAPAAEVEQPGEPEEPIAAEAAEAVAAEASEPVAPDAVVAEAPMAPEPVAEDVATREPEAAVEDVLVAEPVASGESAAAEAIEPEPVAVAAVEPVEPEPVAVAAVEPVEPEPVAVAAVEPVEPEPVAVAAVEPVELEPVAADASSAPAVEDAAPSASPLSSDPERRAAAAAAQTARLLARFRPGQSIDAALEEFEATLADAPVAPEAPVAEPEPASAPAPEAAVEPVTVEPVAAEPVAAEPIVAEPVAAESVAAEPIAAEPVAAAESPAVAEPIAPDAPAPTRRDDRVEQPGWSVVAPDVPARTADGHPAADRPAPQPQPEAPAPAAPDWPAVPQWPNQPAHDPLAFLASRRPASADGLWAASSREVVASSQGAAGPAAVQSCVSCGLSLSATARFCRRCGTRQG